MPPITKVQVKSAGGSVGDPVVSQFIRKVEQGEYAMLVTLGRFTHWVPEPLDDSD